MSLLSDNTSSLERPGKQPIPVGKCQCGCGADTSLATKTCRKDGRIKGQPVRYLPGHHFRSSPVEYIEQEAGYETPCWIWQRSLSIGGYGQLGVKGKIRPAHRVYYERVHGAVPNGYELDHLCRNRRCVNPTHLEPVTRAENVRRGKVAKLTTEQVEAIRADTTSSNRELAECYGVTRDHIACIRPLKAWEESATSQATVEKAQYDAILRPQLGYGYCQCGCGQKTSIAKRNEYRRSHVKGEPVPYLVRHGKRNRGKSYEEVDCGYTSPCWVWKWGKTSEGYGEICINGKPVLAHRMFYEDAREPIPKGLYLDHLCRNRACVNPDHMQAVTPVENARRGSFTKLTAEQAREIFKAPGNYRVIGRQYGVSPQTVCDIKKGRKWKSIT